MINTIVGYIALSMANLCPNHSDIGLQSVIMDNTELPATNTGL